MLLMWSGTSALAASYIPGTTCEAFPSDSWWHADISQLPVHSQSAQWLSHMSSDVQLSPNFGPASGMQTPDGIPITVVNADHATVPVNFVFAAQSDNVPYPLGEDTLVEGGQFRTGDRRTIIVTADKCLLHETWVTRKTSDGWSARSGATWNLKSNALRPHGRMSADAAGFPVLPGLLRYEETQDGSIDHAIRFTTNITDRSFLWPARRKAGSVNDPAYPPMGARFRLKADYTIGAGLREDTKAVLRAMKQYGMVLADNGPPWQFQGTADARWSFALLSELRQVPASAFEAVDTSSLKVSGNSMVARPLKPDVLVEGDSISLYWGRSYSGLYAADHPELRFRWVAVGGSSLAHGTNSLMARQAADLSHHASILTVLIGANDFGYTDDPNAYVDKMFAYVAPFRAAGTKVAVATLLPTSINPATDPIRNVRRAQANALIRAGVGTAIDAVIDFAADPVMGGDEASLNTLLYHDGVHPTTLGQATLAGPYKVALDGLFAKIRR